jgi:L,D-peptidoglycan transpeptidase YkuD (ErfK/YbiS/YcfS/YnhG family)
VFGIGGDGDHGLGAGLEQQVVDHSLVLKGDVGDQAWQGKNEVEVADREQLGLTVRKPVPRSSGLTLRTMTVAAGIVGDNGMVAVLTTGDMATERCGSTTLDRAHHLELAKAQMTGIGNTPGGSMAAEDVRDLQSWTRHQSISLIEALTSMSGKSPQHSLQECSVKKSTQYEPPTRTIAERFRGVPSMFDSLGVRVFYRT